MWYHKEKEDASVEFKGELSIKMLVAGRFLLEFEDLEEAKRVLKRGVRCVENRVCWKNGDQIQVALGWELM